MTWISSDNSIALFAILSAICFLAIFLEQKYVWASKLTGCILVLLTTLILANLHIIPTDAPVYDFVGGYLVPLALPLLLFKADIRANETGKLLGRSLS